ncbi:MAG: DUF4129 domain-containing protein [Chthoniobacteraceae bacterium]
MSAAPKRRRSNLSALDFIEEAVALLRRAPATAHLAYYLGAIPFWLGLLYFIADMGRDAYAAFHLADWSLGVALLYVWKKTWQAVSAAKLRATLTGQPDAPWTAHRVLRTIAAQAGVQPWGLLLRPVAAVLTLPFVWVSGFFQNVTALGDGTPHAESITARAVAQAKLWPWQAHAIVSVVFVFTFFVWLNVCIALGAVPFVLKTFFGIETLYSRDFGAYLNTTFFAATVALTSLAVDPLRKALVVLRCFRGEAIHSGEDLVAELRTFSRATLAAVLLAFCAIQPAQAADTPPKQAEAAELDRRIGEVLERREYAWRAPREKVPPAAGSQGWLQSWIDDSGKTIQRWLSSGFRQLGRFFRWMRNLVNPPKVSTPNGPDIDWVGLSKAVLVLLGSALVGVLIWLLVRTLRRRRKIVIATAVAPAPPDLRSEDVMADQLPEDGWLALAREHAARGELALALRAAWLACLAHLGVRELIRIARHKSNRDYERELRRRVRDRQPLLDAFDDNRLAFERSWYGRHAVTADGFAVFQENLERIRQA